MRKTMIVMKREYIAAVKTKGFIIGLVLAPVLMCGGLIAFLLLKDRVDTTDKHVVILDRTGVVAESVLEAAEKRNASEVRHEGSGKKVKPAYLFKIEAPDREDPSGQRLALSDRVRKGELHAFVEMGEQVVHPGSDHDKRQIKYYARNAALDDLRRWMSWPINNRLRQLRLSDAGIQESDVKDLFVWVDVSGMGLVSLDKKTGKIEKAQRADPITALGVPIGIMMLLFMMIMMSVPGMLHSVMEEKTQRIAEVLLGHLKPFEFMMAKVLSGIAVSLTSSAVYIVGGVLTVTYMGYANYIPFHILPWFFTFMLLAIIMFGALAAAMGATCSEPKDTQALTFPAILPVMIPMFIYFPVAKEPLSGFATWVSLFPPFTPLLMTLRLCTPEEIPAWQPIVGLVGVILCTIFFVWAGGRVFRVAILIQGTPPKLGNMIRWALRG